MLHRIGKAAALAPGLFTRRRRGDVVILLYHRIGPGHAQIETAPDDFDRQMDFLASTQRVLSLDAALADEEGGVVVTFDDGWVDFHRAALPVLARRRVPCTVYVATGAVGDPERVSWADLEEARASGWVTVGSHTHNHVNLARAEPAEAEVEMRTSKDAIEDRLGTACDHFAYPWAVGSEAADRIARRLFATAALDSWKTNRRGRVDPHRLARVPILRNDTPVFFRAKARGRLNGEAMLYRIARRGPWRPDLA